MFLQEVTPDTSGYMIAGFVITFLVMGLYIASIYLRSRNLRQDMSLLEEMEESEAEPRAAGRPSNPGAAKPVTKKTA